MAYLGHPRFLTTFGIIIIILSITSDSNATTTTSMVPASFRQRGYIAEAQSWGHLKTTVNVSQLDFILQQAKTSVQDSINSADFGRNPKHEAKMKVFMTTVSESLDTPARLLDLIDLTFYASPYHYIPSHISFTNPNQMEREKRQLAIGVATLALGVSLFNTIEIAQLNNRVDFLVGENEHIIATLDENQMMINSLNLAVKTFNSSMVKYADELTRVGDQVQLLSIQSMTHAKVETLTQEFVLTFDGLMQLSHGQLSPNLVDKTKITSAFRDLEEQANSKGYHLLHPEVSSLFKCDISYVANSQHRTIDIFIHVPLIKETKMSLYQHIRTPILFNKTAKAPLIFVDSPVGEFLAIDSANSRKGMELNSAFLAACNVEKSSIGPVYLCKDGLSVLSNDILTTSCLGILFSGQYDEKTLTSMCDVKIRDVSEYWSQLDSNLFMIYSKEPTKLTKTCPSLNSTKPTSNITLVENLQLVVVEPGCLAYTNSYSLYGKTEINVERNFVYLPQKVSFTEPIFDPVHLEQVYKELGQLSLPSALHYRELQIYEKTNSWRKHSLSIGGAFLLMALVLGLGIAAYLAFTYWRFRRSTSAPAAENLEMLAR